MDQWGVEGCLERRDEIESWLREEQGKRGWGQKIWAGVTSIFQNIPVNPLDPIPSLFDEVIRRTKKHQSQ